VNSREKLRKNSAYENNIKHVFEEYKLFGKILANNRILKIIETEKNNQRGRRRIIVLLGLKIFPGIKKVS
jgi:hypothetical protein